MRKRRVGPSQSERQVILTFKGQKKNKDLHKRKSDKYLNLMKVEFECVGKWGSAIGV